MIIRLVARAALCLAAAALAACGGGGTAPKGPSAIRLDPLAASVQVGQTTTFSATFVDDQGVAMDAPQNASITWSSSNNGIATVNGGVVTGVAPGTVAITATAQGLPPVSVQVTVTPPPPPTYTGQMAFTFSGAMSGTFGVNSSYQLGPNGPTSGEWAASFIDTDFGSQDFWAIRFRSDNRADLAWFWVVGSQITTPGPRAVSEGIVAFGIDQNGQILESAFEISGGTIDLATATTTRVSGTFALDGHVFGTIGEDVAVTGGTFDLPVLPIAQLFPSSTLLTSGEVPAAARELMERLRVRMQR